MANRREAERQIDELQTLVAALNAQIQGIQAQLEVREKEVRELSGRVDEYRARESAIVVAMTDTQEACKKRISDAEKQAQNIITNANEQSRLTLTEAKARMAELEKRAKLIEEDAYKQADSIIAQAKETAAKCAERSEREANEFSMRLGKLKCELKLAVEQARSSAENFACSLEDVSRDVEGLRNESREIINPVEPEPKEKEYDNAALFIRDMYKLEGRGIPGGEDEQANAPRNEERVWTVDEIIAYQSGSREAEANPPREPEPPQEPEPKDPFKRNSIFPDLFEDDNDEDKPADPIDIDSLLDELME